jgi:hypothetical protein
MRKPKKEDKDEEETEQQIPELPNYKAVTVPPKAVSVDLFLKSAFQMENISKYKTLKEFQGKFGSGEEEQDIKHILYTERYLGLHEVVNQDPETGVMVVTRRIPAMEVLSSYDNNGIVSAVITQHDYSPDLQKIVKTTEKHYFLVNRPYQPNKEFQLLRVKTTLQNYVVKPMNLTLTSELIEDVVLYEESTVNVGGSPTVVKSDPKPMIEILRANPNAIDKKPREVDKQTQKTLEMTTYWRTTYIDRVDDQTLIKTEVSNNVLAANLPQVNSQVLDNPNKKESASQAKQQAKKKDPKAATTTTEEQFRREYTNPNAEGAYISGRGPFYHEAKTISHEDIGTEEIAEAIAKRVFARRNMALSDTLWDITIQIGLPLFLDFAGTKIRLNSFTRKIDGVDVVIPGGDYYLKKTTYKLTSGLAKLDFKQDILVGSQL